MLAAKTALTIRYDALGENTSAEMGAENRLKVETRLRLLEERGVSLAESCMKLMFLVMVWFFWCTAFWVFSLHSVVSPSVTLILWFLPTLAGAVGFVTWLHLFVCQFFLFTCLSSFTLHEKILILNKMNKIIPLHSTTSLSWLQRYVYYFIASLFILEESAFAFSPLLTFSTMAPWNLNAGHA